MGKIKKIIAKELVGGTETTDIYPVSSTKAIYDDNNIVLHYILTKHLLSKYMYGGILTTASEAQSPLYNTFYIAGDIGNYTNNGNVTVSGASIITCDIIDDEKTWNVVKLPYALKDTTDSIETDIATIKDNINNMATQSTVAKIQNDITSIKTTLDTKATVTDLNTTKDTLTQEIKDRETLADTLDTKILNLNAKDVALEESITALDTSLSETKTELTRVATIADEKAPFAGIYNVTKNNDNTTYSELSSVLDIIDTNIIYPGMVITFLNKDGEWETYQFVSADVNDFGKTSCWNGFGSGGDGSGAGNVYNVTVLNPLAEKNYYVLNTTDSSSSTEHSAIAAIPEEYRRIGLVITFLRSTGIWESYQFTAFSLASTDGTTNYWLDENYWSVYNPQGTVKSISINNGSSVLPDENGKINLSIPIIDTVDASPTANSTNPVQSGGVFAAMKDAKSQTGVSLLLNESGEGTDKVYSLSLLNEDEEVISTTASFSGGGGGGGGTTSATKIVLTRLTANPTVKLGDQVLLQYQYDHRSTEDNSSTGTPGTATITISSGATTNTQTVEVSAGTTNTIDVTKYIVTGSNTVRLRMVVDTGDGQQVASLTWTVTAVSLTLTSEFNIGTIVYKGDTIGIPFALSGSGNKVLKWYVDGKETDSRTIASSSSSGTISINSTNLSHGSHSVQLVAELELATGGVIKSNSIYFDVAVREIGNTTPIVATRFDYSDGTIIEAGKVPYASAKQYDKYKLRYTVYDPEETPANVSIYSNDILLTTIKVAFTASEFTYRYMTIGTVEHKIVCGETTYIYDVEVSKTDLTIEEPLDNMSLYLTATGKSNNDTNKESWVYNDITTSFEGFTWGGDGWINNALRLSGTAKATINYRPLEKPSQNVTNAFAFMIRFKVSNVVDEDAVIVKCLDENGIGFEITTQEAKMITSGNSSVSTKFASGEIYNIGFVSFPIASTDSGEDTKLNSNMLYLYIDGVMSGCVQKGATGDSIYQVTPQNITMGSEYCTLDVYSMRAYTAQLTDNQMFDAYIIDLGDADSLLSKYNSNNILDSEGKISVSSLTDELPYIIITGEQANGEPTFLQAAVNNNKNTKYDVTSMLYVDKKNPSKNFYIKGGCIRLQGTSSLAYPRKNYRIYFKNSSKVAGELYLGCDEQGVGGELQAKPKYSLTDASSDKKASAPVDCFCFKADFAESSSSHNTGLANLVNEVMVKAGDTTPAQEYVNDTYNYDVRTTVEGHPCLMFYRNTEQDTPIFGGKFNFNNDKSTESVFGFLEIPGYHDADWVTEKFGGQNPTECWEFLNNDYPMGMFKEADFDTMTVEDGETIPKWMLVWEARYPDDDDINAEYQAGTKKPKYLQALVEWINSTDTEAEGLTSAQILLRQEKFKNEISDYFDVDFLCDYYIINDAVAGVDQRVKNMMWGFWYDPKYTGTRDGVLCYPIYYDNDTIFGVRNDGRLKYNWDIDENTIDPELTTDDKTVYAFAGHDSVIWKNLRDLLSDKLKEAYIRLRTYMTNDELFYTFDTEQSDRYCERIFNKDALYKYVEPKTSGVKVVQDGAETYQEYSYLEAMQGTRKAHRHWFITNRFDLFDARYNTGQFKSTDLNWKGNSAAGAKITVVPNRDYYFAFVRESAVLSHTKVTENQEWSYTYSEVANIGTIFHFYGGKWASKVDLSAWGGFTDLNIPTMPVLQELVLGADGSTYSLTEIAIGSKLPMLQKLDVRNYIKLASLNLNECTKLKEINASGCTELSTIKFAEGSPIATIALPANYQTLRLQSLPLITREGITFENISNLRGLWVENCAKLDGIALLNEILGYSDNNLKYIRITGVDKDGDGSDLIKLYNLGIGGITSDGNNVANKCKLVGTYRLTQLLDDTVFNNLKECFDELNLSQPEYSIYEFNDVISDTKKVTNHDNSTGYNFGNDYECSGHGLKIINSRHGYTVKYLGSGKFVACQLNDSNYLKFSDGNDSVLTGSYGDVMILEPHYWYKGVNDSKKGIHYGIFSSNAECPSSTGTTVKITSDMCTTQAGKAVSISDAYTNISSCIITNSDTTVYSFVIPTDNQYKQFRATSIPSTAYGVLVIDKDGNVLKRLNAAYTKMNMSVNSYLFDTIPDNAYAIYFTVNTSELETFPLDFLAIVTTSEHIEAIEPDWVEHKEQFVSLAPSRYLNSEVDAYINVSQNSSGVGPWRTDVTYDTIQTQLESRGTGYSSMTYETVKDLVNLGYIYYGDTYLMSKAGSTNRTSYNGTTYWANYQLGNNEAHSNILLNTGMQAPKTAVSPYGDYYPYYTVDSIDEEVGGNKILGYIRHLFGDLYFITSSKLNLSTYKFMINDLNNRVIKWDISHEKYNASVVAGKYLDIIKTYDDSTGSDSTCYTKRETFAQGTLQNFCIGSWKYSLNAWTNSDPLYLSNNEARWFRMVINPTELQIVNDSKTYATL